MCMKYLREKFFVTAFIVVLIDQLSKLFALASGDMTRNYGAVFGILHGQRIIFVVIAIFVAVILGRYRKESPMELGLLMGGTIGNLIDRVFYGYVVDFIDLGWWPSFNIADSANTIGVVLVALRILGYGIDWKKLKFEKIKER